MSAAEDVIVVDELKKSYPIYASSLDRLKEVLHPFSKKFHRDFYALKGISLTVNRGEVLGILGKNGSGKSTLLKIITGVSQPTDGSVVVRGHVTAMLELGVGFNPDLSGVENVILNGAIQGFTRAEMTRRMTEILEFADIGDFSEQPVKTYSSGMKSRLAFAASILTDPEILIVDEVLSVGDMRFKQKSLRKIQEVIAKGATVLFVSHDLGAVKSLCDRVVWLHEGTIRSVGDAKAMVEAYTSFMTYGALAEKNTPSSPTPERTSDELASSVAPPENIAWVSVSDLPSFGERGAVIEAVRLEHQDCRSVGLLEGGERLRLRVRIRVLQAITMAGFGLVFKDRLGNQIFGINNYMYDTKLPELEASAHVEASASFTFPHVKNGDYTFTIALSDGTQESHIQHHWIHDAIHVKVANPAPPYSRASLLVLKAEEVAFDVK